MFKAVKIITFTALLAGVTGCTNAPVIEDMFQGSKDSMDASNATEHQSLSMPPNLQLRPPENGSDNNNQTATAPTTPANSSYVTPAPSAAPTTPVYQTSVPATPSYKTPQATAPTTANASGAVDPNKVYSSADAEQADIYQKNGISRYKADGTKKTQSELNEEMRQKKIALEKQNNPNYGTVLNIGNVWND